MIQQEFDQIVNATINSISTLLKIKGGEYAGSEDRLANFKRGAADTGATPTQVCYIYMSKHIDSLKTYIKNSVQNPEANNNLSEPIGGRLDDIINYCILMKALIQETEFHKFAKEHKRDAEQAAFLIAELS